MIMKKLQNLVFPVVAALALAAAATTARAGEGADYDFISSGQKAQVPAAQTSRVARMPAVVVSGERLAAPVDTASYSYNPLADAKSLRTRAEVRAEMLAGLKSAPFLPNVGGEPVGPFFYASLVETGATTPVVLAQRGASERSAR
jgi:hypothetical protein